MLEKHFSGRIIKITRVFHPEAPSLFILLFRFFYYYFLLCPVLPELAAKITQGRRISNEFQPDCKVLQWLEKNPTQNGRS